MKIISWIVLFTMTFNVFASTGSVQALELALDEYQYATTVEWDQKDQKQHEAISLQFAEKLQALIQEQGLTKAEISSVLEKKVTNKNVLATMKAKLGLLAKAATAQEMVSLLSANSKELYVQGASWNGSAEEILMYGGIALIIGAVIWFYATHECTATGQEWQCTSTTTDTSYGSSSSSRCGWVTVCTRWEKKQ